jgi:uncharacterized protein (DUF983 family)
VKALERPNALVVMWRGLVRRCPRCGERDLWTGWFAMRDRCPRCGLPSERGEGYWLGAIAINLGVTEAVFGILVIAWGALTWPDVPWTWLLVVGLVINATFPIFFYPFSKTLFLAVDLLLIHADDRTWRADRSPGPQQW